MSSLSFTWPQKGSVGGRELQVARGSSSSSCGPRRDVTGRHEKWTEVSATKTSQNLHPKPQLDPNSFSIGRSILMLTSSRSLACAMVVSFSSPLPSSLRSPLLVASLYHFVREDLLLRKRTMTD